jgi:integrase
LHAPEVSRHRPRTRRSTHWSPCVVTCATPLSATLKGWSGRSRLPVVFTREEVRLVLRHLKDRHRLVAGLRLLEALRLRVRDVDFGAHQRVVRDGKGGEDRAGIPEHAAATPSAAL